MLTIRPPGLITRASSRSVKKLDSSLEPLSIHFPPSHPHHLFGDVDPDHISVRARRHLSGDARRPGCNVQDRLWGHDCDLVGHAPAPATVLSEREKFREQVVALR